MPIPAGPGAIPAGICTPWVDPAIVSARADMADVTVDPAVLAAACTDASALLYALSGRRYPGVCTSTVRPYGGRYSCQHLTGPPQVWDSWTAATNGGGCGDGGLDLQLYPIRTIVSVKVGGELLDQAAYRIDGQRWLVRQDGTGWPTDQRLDLPDTAPGTFAVTAVHGADPPAAGVSAASTLAAEIAKSRTGLPNGLPRRLTSITRQGVTISRVDPMTYLDTGRVGIWDVDLFLRAYNPARQITRPMVFSPDMPRRRRV